MTVAQSIQFLQSMDCSPPGFLQPWNFQTRTLKCIAIPFSKITVISIYKPNNLNTREIKSDEFQIHVNYEIVNIKLVPAINV